MGTKIRDTDSYSSRPDILGVIDSLASWTDCAGDGDLTSYKSDLQQAGFLG